MNRPVSVGLVAFLVAVTVAGITVPLAVAAAPAVTSPEPAIATAQSESDSITAPEQSAALATQEFDSTRFAITVYENGSAQWTFEHRQQLADSEEQDQFEAFAAEFESEETEVYDRFTTQAESLTERGAERTDREMEAREFSRSAQVEEGLNPTGVVTMSFTWDEFAAVEDGSVIAGDVFEDLYITSDQTMLFRPGGDLVFQDVSPDDAVYSTDNLEAANSVRWNGEREFVSGHPRVVFDDPAVVEGSSDEPFPAVFDAGPRGMWPLMILGIVIAIGGAFLWYRRTGDESDPADSAPAAQPAGSAGSEASSDTAEESEPLSDEELLTDDDRVVKLIRENGGRMKQVRIVEETGWSKSKVSMLLSDMEEEGTISKLRVGRENIISLEGFEPEATKSPFDE